MIKNFRKLQFQVLNYNKIVTISKPKTMIDKIKVGGQLFFGTLNHGIKSCYYDYKLTKSFGDQFTAYQLYLKFHIDRELFKVFPFLFIFLLPGSVAYLPIYAYIFPNAIPTNFLFEDQYQQRFSKKLTEQKMAQRLLFQQQNIIKNFSNANQLKETFILKKNLFEQQFNLKNLNSDQLSLICQHFQIEYISLLNVPNKIYHFIFNIHNYIYNFYYYLINSKKRNLYQDPYKIINIGRPFFVEFIRQKVLIYQLDMYFEYINTQDLIFDYQDRNYQKYAIERGLTNGGLKLENYNGDWIRFTQQSQLTNTQKIWYSILYSQLQ
ncbi:unnamed protein product [Paramecium pentaurelia]|uniref:Letm1 RBD domain-containing protein n=1 Tax=Paramecium pentaurelia TaxID=43138 RepID=A0A8S1SKJ0_9CILI|nr:unnamed protein product [Paramecium pentaurelia]